MNLSFSNYMLVKEAIKMPSIPHLIKMTPVQAIDFFLSEDEEWDVTEKVDGYNVSFGLDESGQMFVKSKTQEPQVDTKHFEELAKVYPHNIVFAKLFNYLEDNSFQDWYEQIVRKNNSELKQLNSNFTGLQIFGELFSGDEKANVLQYKKEKIGRGAIYLFFLFLNSPNDKKGINITNTKVGMNILKQFKTFFDNKDGWKIYIKTVLDVNLNSNNLKNKIKTFLSINKELFLNKKRDADTVKNRALADEELRSLLSKYSNSLINQVTQVPSSLGSDKLEGVIVRNIKNGAIAKFVDPEFARQREELHAGSDFLKNLKSIFKDKIDIILHSSDSFSALKRVSKVVETEKQYKTIDEIINVLFQDAFNETPELKLAYEGKNFDKTFNSIKQAVQQHLEECDKVIDSIDPNNIDAVAKAKMELDIEKNRVFDFYRTAKNAYDLKDTGKFYTELAKIFIGPKGINELKQYLAK